MRPRFVATLLCAVGCLAPASRASAQDTSVVRVSTAPFQWRYAFDSARTAWQWGLNNANFVWSKPAAEPMMAAQPILLRFQLIKAMDTKNTDPDIANIDAVLKDLFRFPGYKLLSQAAIAVDFPGGSGRASLASTSQELSAEGRPYRLMVVIDSVTATAVRMSVRLIGEVPMSELLSTTLSVSFGKTVVLGNTQPAGNPGGTLILAVKPEIRQ